MADIFGLNSAQATAIANAVSGNFQANQSAFNLNAMNSANSLNQNFLNQQQGFNQNAANIANAWTALMAAQTMNFNANEAQKNREWQEYMSNTSYQRAVQDMIKAGINPILAATNGGAGTGTGSAASVSIPSSAMATSGLQNADMASISALSGQAFQESAALQAVEAITSGLGNFASALGLKDMAEALSKMVDKNGKFSFDLPKIFQDDKKTTDTKTKTKTNTTKDKTTKANISATPDAWGRMPNIKIW